MGHWRLWVIGLIMVAGCSTSRMEFVQVAANEKGFVLANSQKRFIPWGHNYDVNDPGGETKIDWKRVELDLDDLRKMRADVIRVHLQVPHYMLGPDKVNPQALSELSHLLRLAKKKRIYLDITGLASYNIHNRADWYDSLHDQERWRVQARFWEAVAKTCANSPVVFCYDLMNEPVVGGKPTDSWYAGRMGDYEFVQRLSREQGDRAAENIAQQWTAMMVQAIRRYDKIHAITIGMLPAWGPSPKWLKDDLDFIAVHIYPSAGKVDQAINNLKQFDVGKPIVVEETFPLACSVDDEREFLLRSRGIASGWIGQYPQERPAELEKLRQNHKISPGQSMYLAWIELFEQVGPEMLDN
ncbi:MAG TPA: cellulase family glycosylhydrolase [Tepidisphaeraceae bacterium]|jgi:hypothetical protein